MNKEPLIATYIFDKQQLMVIYNGYHIMCYICGTKNITRPPTDQIKRPAGLNKLNKEHSLKHCSMPQHKGVFANSCVHSFVALEAWLMFSSRLWCDSLAVRTESQSLILFARPRTPPKPSDTHVSMHIALSLSLLETHTHYSLHYSSALSLSMLSAFSLFSIHTNIHTLPINHMSAKRAPEHFYGAQTGP